MHYFLLMFRITCNASADCHISLFDCHIASKLILRKFPLLTIINYYYFVFPCTYPISAMCTHFLKNCSTKHPRKVYKFHHILCTKNMSKLISKNFPTQAVMYWVRRCIPVCLLFGQCAWKTIQIILHNT